MTPDKMKNMISDLFERYDSCFNDPEKLYESLHDEGRWWVPGSTPMSGDKTKPQMIEAMKGFQHISDTGLRITAKSFLIQGDRAAVEAESYVKFKNGKVYANQYHYLFEFRDEKIFRVKEYMDTAKMLEVLASMGPPPA